MKTFSQLNEELSPRPKMTRNKLTGAYTGEYLGVKFLVGWTPRFQGRIGTPDSKKAKWWGVKIDGRDHAIDYGMSSKKQAIEAAMRQIERMKERSE